MNCHYTSIKQKIILEQSKMLYFLRETGVVNAYLDFQNHLTTLNLLLKLGGIPKIWGCLYLVYSLPSVLGTKLLQGLLFWFSKILSIQKR